MRRVITTLVLTLLTCGLLGGCVVAPAYPDYSYGYGYDRYPYAYPGYGYRYGHYRHYGRWYQTP